METAKTVAILVTAAVAELGGAYMVWRWRREGGPVVLVALGAGALLLYAIVQTFQPLDRFGRVYAAYAGVFLLGAIMWGWLVDGAAPDRADVVGAGIVAVGIATILWGRRVLG